MDDLNLNTPQLEDNDNFDAAQALLDRWGKKDQPDKAASDTPDPDENADAADDKETAGDEGDKEQDQPDPGDEQDDEDPQKSEGDEDEEKAEDEKPPVFADDAAKVKISVDGAEHEVSVKDLKRLWGQEASLTRKSQEVAQEHKTTTERRGQYETALDRMYQKAVERAKPYTQIDFALAAKNLSNEDYAALKQDAENAFKEVKFFEEELKQHVGTVTKEAQEAHKKAAGEAVKMLTDKDSQHYIPDWNEKVYADLRDYGVKLGIPREQMDNSTSAPSFKILWMAREYEKGLKVATKKKAKVVGKKPLSAKAPKSGEDNRPAQAFARLQKTGSVEDAAMTLFERWANG